MGIAESEKIETFPDVQERYLAYYDIVEASNTHDEIVSGGIVGNWDKVGE